MTIEEVKTVIFRYIFGYCNTQRVNSFDLDGLHRWFTESRRHPRKQLHKPTATLYILPEKCCKGFAEDNRNSKYISVNFGRFLTAHLLTVPDMISTLLLICINQGQPKKQYSDCTTRKSIKKRKIMQANGQLSSSHINF